MSSFARNPNFIESLKSEATGRLQVAREVIKDRIVDSIDEPAITQMVKKRKVVIASSPGDPPRRRTGGLMDSIETGAVNDEGDSLSVSIGSFSEYSPFLERGTGLMAPRPFLRPALLASKTDVMRVMGGGNA